MEKGTSKGLMIMVGIAIFSIMVIIITNTFISAEESSGGVEQGICLNVPGLTAEDCE